MQEKSVRYVLRFWGMDRKGAQVNSLLTFGTLRAARCAAVRVLFELSPRVHFCIASVKDKALLRLLAEIKASPEPTRPHQHSAPVLQPGDNYYEDHCRGPFKGLKIKEVINELLQDWVKA